MGSSRTMDSVSGRMTAKISSIEELVDSVDEVLQNGSAPTAKKKRLDDLQILSKWVLPLTEPCSNHHIVILIWSLSGKPLKMIQIVSFSMQWRQWTVYPPQEKVEYDYMIHKGWCHIFWPCTYWRLRQRKMPCCGSMHHSRKTFEV